MTPSEIRDSLRSILPFARLSSAGLDLVIQGIEVLEGEAGDELFATGAESDAFFVVLRGACDVSLAADSGKGQERVVTRLHPGETFGELSLLAPTTRRVTVRACEATVLASVHSAAFHQLREAEPEHCLDLVLGLIEVIATRLDNAGPVLQRATLFASQRTLLP